MRAFRYRDPSSPQPCNVRLAPDFRASADASSASVGPRRHLPVSLPMPFLPHKSPTPAVSATQALGIDSVIASRTQVLTRSASPRTAAPGPAAPGPAAPGPAAPKPPYRDPPHRDPLHPNRRIGTRRTGTRRTQTAAPKPPHPNRRTQTAAPKPPHPNRCSGAFPAGSETDPSDPPFRIGAHLFTSRNGRVLFRHSVQN
jgi:hypothetical protein